MTSFLQLPHRPSRTVRQFLGGRSLRRPEQKTGAASPFHFARAGNGRQTVISETTCCDRDFHGAGGLLEIPES